MNSSSGRGGAPRSRQNASKSACSSECVRANSWRKASQPEGSSPGRPEKVGGTSGSRSSAGLHETILTQGRPEAISAGKLTTLSSTITSGSVSSDLDDALVHMLRAIDQRIEGGSDEA